jgi:hypothetical protein
MLADAPSLHIFEPSTVLSKQTRQGIFANLTGTPALVEAANALMSLPTIY